ncbi:uncharacterized protein LOC143211056 [Lasioglossum baleicum]|uniref:uncharacterized protein LOC143211056 n=1 Tax=Lasioglossum baleicum TaxID=434251 RepID=UPI003FCEBF87
MEEFFRPSDPRDRIIRQKYLNRTKVAHYSLIGTFAIGGLLFIFSPLVAESNVTPVNTAYFAIPREEFWGFCVTYALNILHIVNAASVLFLDLLIICLIWHAACKFVLLGEAFGNINQKRRVEMKKWIREHQDAISYANDVNHVIAPLAIKSTIAVALYVIVSCLLLTHDLLLLELSKFFIVTAFSMLRFLACSWAADTMTKNAQDIGWTVYATPWTHLAPVSRKERIIIIQMCQRPVTINAGRFLTAWSLHFCGQVYYTIFSTFWTIRAILHG